MKICRDCGELKPLDQFYRSASTKDGAHVYCKGCHGARNKRSLDGKGPLYSAWCAMKARCAGYNELSRRYYQQKGIRVCDDWLAFEVFEAWAKSSGWIAGLELDRIDPGGDYCPGNCQWITHAENVRRAHLKYGEDELVEMISLVEFGLSISKASRRLGFSSGLGSAVYRGVKRPEVLDRWLLESTAY